MVRFAERLERPLFTLIRDEAGIGKTRLAEELVDWTACQDIATLRAACYASAGSLPYAPVSSWLRTATAYASLDGLADNWLREVSRVLPELAVDRPDLRPPEPLSGGWQRQHLFTALAHAILRQMQPFLLVLDDLQWCDPDTLEWLCFLLHFDSGARFLLLGTVRDDGTGQGQTLTTLCQDLQHESRLVEINLERLAEPETATLGAHVAGRALAKAEAAHLFEETEGVPQYIVERARAG